MSKIVCGFGARSCKAILMIGYGKLYLSEQMERIRESLKRAMSFDVTPDGLNPCSVAARWTIYEKEIDSDQQEENYATHSFAAHRL